LAVLRLIQIQSITVDSYVDVSEACICRLCNCFGSMQLDCPKLTCIMLGSMIHVWIVVNWSRC